MRRTLLAWLRLCVVLLAVSVAGGGRAQDAPDFETFRSFANSVETDLREGRASDDAFEELRRSLVEWREQFLARQDANAVEVDALRAQLDALGPAPAEGESEPDDIAERRADLTAELADARQPRIRAEEAYARANALIGRIDDTLRDRQTAALFQHQPTPLMPDLWADAWVELGQASAEIQTEISQNIANRLERGTLWDRLPIVILLLVVALVLVVRGPGWVEHLIRRVEARSGEQGRIVYGFLVSLGAIAVPIIGISLINAALISTNILGPTGRSAALGINLAIFVYAASRWLGRRVFPDSEGVPSPLTFDGRLHPRGRRLSLGLGISVGILLFIRILDSAGAFTPEALSVFSLPVFVFLGVVLFRLGKILTRVGQAETDADSTSGFPIFVIRILGRAVQAVAVVSPLAAAIGYHQLAEALLLPTALTLGVFALLGILHLVFRAAFGLFRGMTAEESSRALTPVLFSFVLGIASLPLIALIWGARLTDIGELWARFRAGVRLGDTTISPGAFLTFALIFAFGFLLTRLVQGTMRSSVLPRTRIDKGGQNALISGLGYVGMTLAALAGITSAGIDLSSLAIVVGALGVGIGFGLQNIVNNFVSGIILLIERPISEGDWVEINGQMGYVRSISVRSTRIETFDRTDVIVPNGDLISGTVTNWTRGNSIGRAIVPVGVAYGTDTRKVERVLKEVAEAHPIVAVHPPPQVLFIGFGADSLDFEIRAILTDVSFLLSARSDMCHEIARRFQEEGIEIPFAQRDIWLRNPEALSRGPS